MGNKKLANPSRQGLLELLQHSSDSQFVIPVYQRNYTWTKEKEVKKFLDDLENVISGKYDTHFLGIIIYLEKPLEYGFHERSIIDGQQRLTTTFLTLYAMREIYKELGDMLEADKLVDLYLQNKYSKNDAYKDRLKPLVSDDNVYQQIVNGEVDEIKETDSNVYKNFIYIKNYLNSLINKGISGQKIVSKLDDLFVVTIPIDEDDNPQKVFESINATGIKLTAADLIRNYLLMNLQSDKQDKFYNDYWLQIEKNVSHDSNKLQDFFRIYLAIKKFKLSSKANLYNDFIDWKETNSIDNKALFVDLLEYAKVYNTLIIEDINNLDSKIIDSINDYRKLNSTLALTTSLEFFKMYKDGYINADTLNELFITTNSYLIRRGLCDLDAQNISRLFPEVLNKTIKLCNGDYDDIVDIYNQELVGNTASTSNSYMPTDEQMHEFLFKASVYGRDTLRIVLDRLELSNNPAPVDLSKLSIEHLMPQTPTPQWIEALHLEDNDAYMKNVHRLGNLTLAAKHDNSKMSNNVWQYKNDVLASTNHLTLNSEILKVGQWGISQIDKRTNELIDKICEIYPYPDVDVNLKNETEGISQAMALEGAIKLLLGTKKTECIKKRRMYKEQDNGYVFLCSKSIERLGRKRYWFGYRPNVFDAIDAKNKYLVLVCRDEGFFTIKIEKTLMDSITNSLNFSYNPDGKTISHYHVMIMDDGKSYYSLEIPKPKMHEIDVSSKVVK